MNFQIAIQLYSVRDDMAADFEGTLKKVKALGYDGVEFAGLFGKSAAEIKAMCKEIGLTPISAHVPFEDMMADPELLSTYAEIGCKYVVIPYLTEEYRPGNDKFNEVIEGAKMLGEKANSLGMKLCYHNHDFEFVKLDGEYALDILYNEVPAALLQTELDTCWVNVGGENPAQYIRKYSGRAEIVHLKDFVRGKFELRPVGSGLQNFPEILEAAKDAGALWVVVEQDLPSMDKTALECAEMSIKYLNSL